MSNSEAEVPKKPEQQLGAEKPVALLFLKPFFAQREDIREAVEEECEEKGLQIIKEGDFQFNREAAAEFYEHIKEKPVYGTYAWYMSLPGRPVHWYIVTPGAEPVANFYGEVRGIVKQFRDRFGRKRPDLPPRKGVNVIHGSDSPEGTEKELGILGIDFEELNL